MKYSYSKKIFTPEPQPKDQSDHMSGSWFLCEIEKLFREEIKAELKTSEVLARNIAMNFYQKVPRNVTLDLTVKLELSEVDSNSTEYRVLCTFEQDEVLKALITSVIVIKE